MVFLLEQKHRIMVTYEMLFNSSLTNLEKITEQRNKLITVNQRGLPKSLRWRDFAAAQALTIHSH